MKRLTLLRHAKSGWDAPVARDFDRALNAKGRRAAATMGRHLHDEGLVFDRVVASPAVRVVETLQAFAEGYGQRLYPNWDRRLYLAAGSTILEVVQESRAPSASLLLAGHNPGIEELVLLLVPDAAGDLRRDSVEEKYPTASAAEIEFDVDGWAQVSPGGGRLVRFVRPRDLDPTLGPDAVG